jgi:microcin C transport system substrate-binding protein
MLTRRSILKTSLALGALPGFLPRALRAQEGTKTVHALAMHGDPKYGPDFAHFDYVNPEAPKGGTLRSAAIGTFDSFHAYILRGSPGPSSSIETLLTSSDDEAFTEYGLLAESIEVPEDRSWVAFTLHAEAQWHDGKPITVDDVIFSFNILKEKGRPLYRIYYSSVKNAEPAGDRKVKFNFSGEMNRELPLIMGQLPILPKHYWESRDFEQPTLEAPLGSGQYVLDSFEAGRSVTLRRKPDYWGAKLPVNIGQLNFDVLRFDYFRDITVAFEAFKAGDLDRWIELSSSRWAKNYDFPAVKDGRVIKKNIPDNNPQGMQGYIFNLRRPMFSDRRVREAIGYAYDFDWMNKTLSDGQLVRTRSYFQGSELAATGLPTGEELAVLEPFRGKVPDEVFSTEYQPPKTDGSGNIRANLREAAKLLKEAGWEVQNGTLVQTSTGKPLEFEILLDDPFVERSTQPFIQNLERMGIRARMRTVDSAQYQNRTDSFDFDMIIVRFGQTLSPGNEQREFWGSANADRPGSQNVIGIKDPVVDQLIELVISAESRESLIARTRALDRVLQWGIYLVPQFNVPFDRVAFWNKYSFPAEPPKYGTGLGTWWLDPEKDAALKGRQGT